MCMHMCKECKCTSVYEEPIAMTGNIFTFGCCLLIIVTQMTGNEYLTKPNTLFLCACV